MKSHEKFKKNAQAMLAFDINDTTDWRNNVRECPLCGEVWVKVYGCEGTTICGKYEGLGAAENEGLGAETRKNEGILGWAWKKIDGIYKYAKATPQEGESTEKKEKFVAKNKLDKSAGCKK